MNCCRKFEKTTGRKGSAQHNHNNNGVGQAGRRTSNIIPNPKHVGKDGTIILSIIVVNNNRDNNMNEIDPT